MESNKVQKSWMAVVVWVALLGTTAYTSNATVSVFNAIISTLFQTLVNGIGDLFTNYGVLFATLLSIGLVFLILSAWLGLVSYTFEVGAIAFGKEEEDEDEESDIFTLPGQIARYLGFSWGLFYILFLILPMVM